MELFLELTFFSSVLLVAYHYIGYPGVLRVLVRSMHKRGTVQRPPAVHSRNLPTIAVIVPIHNEADVIARKVENLCELTYPHENLSLVLALDGCTDRSLDVALEAIDRLGGPSIWRVAERKTNIGKIAVLNEEIGSAVSELIALTDASAIVGQEALLRAATHFADGRVGVVCGTYRLLSAGHDGEQAYWTYQNRLKADEAALAAPMGAHGAFYMFRRELWAPLPADTINDDFILPLNIVARGYKAIYDQSIVATELEQSKAKQDFRRRVRIGAGNLQQFIRMARLADPRRGWLAFVFLSGKGLRALVPLLLLAAFLASVALAIAGHPFYGLLVIAEVGVMALCFFATFAGLELRPRQLASLSYLLVGNLAAAIGCFLFLVGQKRKVWRVSTVGKIESASGDKPNAN